MHKIHIHVCKEHSQTQATLTSEEGLCPMPVTCSCPSAAFIQQTHTSTVYTHFLPSLEVVCLEYLKRSWQMSQDVNNANENKHLHQKTAEEKES